MTRLSVVIVSADNEERAVLKMQTDGTGVADTVGSFLFTPADSTETMMAQIQNLHPDVALIGIQEKRAPDLLHIIEQLHSRLPALAVFATGDINKAQLIVGAMRSGANEFLESPTTTTALLEAFIRRTTSLRRAPGKARSGTIVSFINAKGGCGATTLAVNVAMALSSSSRPVALIDMAPIGAAALHLKQQPQFTIVDVMRNLDRLDSSLLAAYMATCADGMQLLAGTNELQEATNSAGDFARLVDILVAQYEFVLIDLSSRTDGLARIICDLSKTVLLVSHVDLVSLYCAAKMVRWIQEGTNTRTLGLLLNRFQALPGFGDREIEAAIHAKVLWKFASDFHKTTEEITHGVPVIQSRSSQLSRDLQAFAALLLKERQGSNELVARSSS